MSRPVTRLTALTLFLVGGVAPLTACRASDPSAEAAFARHEGRSRCTIELAITGMV